MQSPILLLQDNRIARRDKARSKCRCSLFIQKSFHVLEERGPSFGSKVIAIACEPGQITFAKIHGLYGGFLCGRQHLLLLGLESSLSLCSELKRYKQENANSYKAVEHGSPFHKTGFAVYSRNSD